MLIPDNNSNIPVNRQLVLLYRNAVIKEISKRHDIGSYREATNELRAEISKSVNELVILDTQPLSMLERGLVLQDVLDELFGFGPLGPLLRDPSLRELFVQEHDNIFIRQAKEPRAPIKTSVKFDSVDHFLRIIERILTLNRLMLTDENPIASMTLSNGNLLIITKPVDKYTPTLRMRMPG